MKVYEESWIHMDAETISTLKTVCTAGHACAGFNEDSNAQLEQLAQDGFLVVVSFAKSKRPRRAYQPTEKGRQAIQKLAVHGAA
jgi:ribulose bisphosphate carboxylase small subunit